MVMIRLDHNILSDINGRGNGGNYRRNWCGFKWQGNSTKKRNSSPAQKFINGIFGKAFRMWQHYPSKLTREERNSWKTYAREHPIKNKKGELKPTTDRNAFISYNTGLLQSGQPMQLMAPPPSWTPRAKPLADMNIITWGYSEVILTFPTKMNTLDGNIPERDQIILLANGYEMIDSAEREWLSEYTMRLSFPVHGELNKNTKLKYQRTGSNDFVDEWNEFVRNFEIPVHMD